MKPDVVVGRGVSALQRQFVERGKSGRGGAGSAACDPLRETGVSDPVLVRVDRGGGFYTGALVQTGAELGAWLEDCGMSQSEFAVAVGLSRKTVGKHVRSDELPRWLTLAICGLECVPAVG